MCVLRMPDKHLLCQTLLVDTIDRMKEVLGAPSVTTNRRHPSKWQRPKQVSANGVSDQVTSGQPV